MEVRTKRWKCFNRCKRRCYGVGACTFCGYVEDEEESRCSCWCRGNRCSCWCNNGKCYCCCQNGKCYCCCK